MADVKSIAAIAAALFAFATTSAVAQELPLRQPGAWELSTSMDEGAGPRTSKLTMCIEGDMERNSVAASIAEHKQTCSKYDITRKDGIVQVDANCTYGRAQVASVTTMKGDFKSSFDVRIESTTVPPNAEISQPVKRVIEQTGRYIGSDCGDLLPGEARGENGEKVLVQ